MDNKLTPAHSSTSNTDKILFYSILLGSAVTVICIDFIYNATFDSGDGIQHYLIAKYSWSHKYLLLDLWGKPIFTLLSSPFAQFGLKGMYVFQVLCAAFTSIFLFKIAIAFKLKFAWILPLFIFFSPIYFAVINTGLTEILFGCLLVLSVRLVISKRFIAASVVASFILFVRPEGFLLLPLLALYFAMMKQWKALPFLLTSVVFFTLISYSHFHDWLWVITNNYKLSNNTYKGMEENFFHYFVKYNEIWGKVYLVFLIAGLISIYYRIVRNKKTDEFIWEKILLLTGSFFAILLLHSISCSVPGIINNLGMVRYMATLIPSSAIIALAGMNAVTHVVEKRTKRFTFLLPLLSSLFIIAAPFRQWYYPFHPNNEETVINRTADWLKPCIGHKKVWYSNPYLACAANMDPFDSNKTSLIWAFCNDVIQHLPDSTFIVWDSHFSPQEGNTKLSCLISDTSLLALRAYSYSDVKEPFEIFVFIKSEAAVKRILPFTVESVMNSRLTANYYRGDSVYFNLNSIPKTDTGMLSPANNTSGKTSLLYSPEREYGPVFSNKLSNIGDYFNLRMVNLTFRIFPCDSMKDVHAVSEIKRKDKMMAWSGDNIPHEVIPNRWNTVHLVQLFNVNDALNGNDVLNFYFWNQGKRAFYIDSVRIGYYCLEK